MVRTPYRWSGSGQDTVPEVRKWSVDAPTGLEVVGRPSRRTGSDRETLPKVRKWSENPPK